jgi:hypothetical protein
MTFDRAATLERHFNLAAVTLKRNKARRPRVSNDQRYDYISLNLPTLDEPISTSWNAAGAVPALFVNTTSVQTGARILISPIYMEPSPTDMHLSDAMNLDRGKQCVDMELSTAVGLSARFPWITPPGWL